MDTAEAITLGLAVYGAGLSSITAALNARRDRKRVVVKCGSGYVRDPADPDGDAVPVITIEATNVGVRPIEVIGAGFDFAGSDDFVEPTPILVHPGPVPLSLPDGMSVRFHYRTERDTPTALQAEVSSVYVRTTPHRKWHGQPDEWLKPLKANRRWWGGSAP